MTETGTGLGQITLPTGQLLESVQAGVLDGMDTDAIVDIIWRNIDRDNYVNEVRDAQRKLILENLSPEQALTVKRRLREGRLESYERAREAFDKGDLSESDDNLLDARWRLRLELDLLHIQDAPVEEMDFYQISGGIDQLSDPNQPLPDRADLEEGIQRSRVTADVHRRFNRPGLAEMYDELAEMYAQALNQTPG